MRAMLQDPVSDAQPDRYIELQDSHGEAETAGCDPPYHIEFTCSDFVFSLASLELEIALVIHALCNGQQPCIYHTQNQNVQDILFQHSADADSVLEGWIQYWRPVRGTERRPISILQKRAVYVVAHVVVVGRTLHRPTLILQKHAMYVVDAMTQYKASRSEEQSAGQSQSSKNMHAQTWTDH
eukprot:scaffold63647_cov22-Tisochrysis_lutea.AAC.1